MGFNRQKIAAKVLQNTQLQLTKGQRRRFVCQETIGRVLQGQRVGLGRYLKWPGSLNLYAKLWYWTVKAKRSHCEAA